MQAIVLKPGTKNLKLTDWPEPKIRNPSEVKVKVVRVGICGTDREEAAGGRAAAPDGEDSLIIGHEMLGQVTEVGSSVTKVKPQDFVVITVRRGCSTCPACHIFRSDLCTTGNYKERGIKGLHGFHAEYVVDDEAYLVKVPKEIVDIAILTEPTTVVEKAIEEAGLIQLARLPFMKNKSSWLEGKTALIAGLGPIGLLAAMVLRLRGAVVFGLDIVEESNPRAQILKAFGGTYLNDRTIDPKTFTQKYPPIDLLFDAAGIAKLDFDLLDFLAINGLFVLTGVPGDQRLIDIDGAKLMRKLVLKNQVIVGSVNESIYHFEKALLDLKLASKKWPGVVQKLITQKVPYSQFQSVLSHHTPDEIKVVIEWNT